MKKSTRNRIIIVAVILLLAVCIIPYPVRRDITATGARITADGEMLENVTVTIKGWQLNFLFREDVLKVSTDVKADIGSIAGKEINAALTQESKDVYSCNYSNYDKSQENYIWGYCWFNADFDTVLLDEQESGTYYAVSVDGELEPEEILEMFEQYIQ